MDRGLASLLAAALMLVIGAAPVLAGPVQAEPAPALAAIETADGTGPEPANVILGRVISVVVGIAAGEMVLHGLLGLPGLPSIVAGGYAGWWVYTGYIEPQVKSGVGRIAAAADGVRLYWIGARDPG